MFINIFIMKKRLLLLSICSILSYLTLGHDISYAASDELSIDVSKDSIAVDEWVKLTIDTDEDYVGKINFTKLEYKSSSKRTDIDRTSSTYVANYSYTWQDWYYQMEEEDEGQATFTKFIKFKKAWSYKIYAKDKYWSEDSIIIKVEGSDNWEISLSTDDSSPDTQEYIDLTIKTDDYTGKLTFNAKYNDGTTTSRTKISNLQSSKYFSKYSTERENWYYKMTKSDDWKVTLDNLVKFEKDWYYRIYVTDSNDNSTYIQFKVWDIKNNNKDDDSNEDNDDITYTEIYTARNGKSYIINYNKDLQVYESPSFKTTEYFISSPYIKRYIDSKNKSSSTSTDYTRITKSYLDKSNDLDRYVAPNGKVYFITENKGIYSSKQIKSAKTFNSFNTIKYYIRDNNPLIWM